MIELPASQVVMWSMVVVQEGSGVLGAPAAGAPAGAAPTGAGGGSAGAPPGGGLGLMLPLMGVMVFFVIMTMMSGRKEKKRRAEMMASIGKRDRVQTIGGMIGNIIEIKGNEYLLETDRGTNSRAWIAKSAVTAVIKSANSGSEGAEVGHETAGETAKA